MRFKNRAELKRKLHCIGVPSDEMNMVYVRGIPNEQTIYFITTLIFN